MVGVALSPGPPLHPELRPADTFIMAKLDVYIPERHRIVIHGKVQGVGFRLWLRNVASSLSLVGSCRQLPDGACEAIVQGEKTLLKQFVAAAPRSRAERVVFEVRSGLDALVQRAVAAGCQRDQLVLDPGLGFGKVGGQNLELLRRLPELRTLDRPLLVGASRKSFLGGLAGPLEPPAERLEPSLAAAAWAAAGGAAVLRVHDVGATRKFLAAWTAIDSAGTGGPA